MKKIPFLLALCMVTSCKTYIARDQSADKKEIVILLDDWHKAAADAKFNMYFDMMTSDAVFIGTDPTENWNQEQFKAFAQPYFKSGKTWNFKAIERNIFVSEDRKTAWFDELLDTQMKICRGSGVVKLVGGQWKITHYVLSMTVPNDKVEEVVKIKSAFDDAILQQSKK